MPFPVWPLLIYPIHGPNILGSHVILFFTASDFTSIPSHIHNWVLFLLWLHLFILSGVISPLISSSILGTYWPGEFIFQRRIFLPFHTVHGVLKARILKWFATPFSSGPLLSELSTMTHPSWVALHGMAHSFIELHKAVLHVISLVRFLWLRFSFQYQRRVMPKIIQTTRQLCSSHMLVRLCSKSFKLGFSST